MFEEASNRITVWLSKTKIISSDQEVVCKWGMTHILDTLFNIATFTNASGNSCIYSRIYSVAVIRRWLSCKNTISMLGYFQFSFNRGIANSSVYFSFYCLLFIADSFEFALSRCFDACI